MVGDGGIQPKNCEISNSGGNIFCRTWRKGQISRSVTVDTYDGDENVKIEIDSDKDNGDEDEESDGGVRVE